MHWHRVGLDTLEAVRSRCFGVRRRLQAVQLKAVALRAFHWRVGYGPMRKSSLSAPRSTPLLSGRKPGADTALFLYHPYFSGSRCPDGERIQPVACGDPASQSRPVSALHWQGDSPGPCGRRM
jgi:hypothetical protein